MGGFVYIDKSERSIPSKTSSRGNLALAAMKSKGLRRESILARSTFELHVYGKKRVVTENVLEFDNGDFVVGTGTLIYKKGMGASALQRLYADYSNNDLSFEDFYGHFAVWIFQAGCLTLFNDYRGMYQVYLNEDRSIVSSAFLPVYESLTTRTPNTQEIFEYLTYAAHYGERTILKEVRLLDPTILHGFSGVRSEKKKKISIFEIDEESSFTEHVNLAHEALSQYFSVLASIFGDAQSIGLTGGYDSRLTLAHLRRAGVRPIVYVQGERDSIDVRVAKSIAKGEGFDIQYDVDEARPEFGSNESRSRVETAYHYLDGLPHGGLFNDMAMVSDDRQNRERKETLRLYGMGGEAFRKHLHMSDRPHSVSEFLTSEYDIFDESVYAAQFDKTAFLKNIAQKIIGGLNLDGDGMSRAQTGLTYSHFSLCRGAGPQMTLQNERAFSLVSYSEPIFTYPSSRIPLKYKYLGRFEAELIRLADPKLASYQSAYGFSFSDGPSLQARIREKVKQYTPISIRPLLRRQVARMEQIGRLPFYFQENYLKEVFPDGCPNIEPFLDVTKCADHKLLSRAYTIELILSGQFADNRPL